MSGPAIFDRPPLGAGRDRGWFIAIGCALLLLGAAGLFMVTTLTLVSTLWFGILLIVAGAVEIVEALGRPEASEALSSRIGRFLAGLIYLLGGLAAVFRPLEASFALTLVLGATLIASGVARAVWAFAYEVRTSRAAVILFAVLSVLLGAAIIAKWPYSGLWAIGLSVSCDLLSTGLSWLGVGLFGEAQTSPAISR
ncbi:HdeD family acid-resistance protein [Methylobacterium nonmethylotrophicum]|uniref:HdeD family acid-resistance protein n=1 Tax=Methylobacterium nonmethylotrophicum TaxID=1141884 RepID=A0A4Z0NMB5_9HYPH|nr:DUF308 domain-containing protein [Methylobacterium nonmethylotrophicum]TGD97709.1 hypothetical protein EU555_18940 [Methylobacterium nonmethylotrophicum]